MVPSFLKIANFDSLNMWTAPNPNQKNKKTKQTNKQTKNKHPFFHISLVTVVYIWEPPE